MLTPARLKRHAPLVAVTAALACLAVALPTQWAAASSDVWVSDARIDIATLPAFHAPAPEAVDWDEDGDLDLVVGMGATNQYGGIALFRRGQDGKLPAEPVSVWTGGSPPSGGMLSGYYRPVVADWNGDGKKDLLYGQQSSSYRAVVACLNRGTDAAPVFQAASCSLLRVGEHFVGRATGSSGGNVGANSAAYMMPDVTDWDADGDLDLLVGTGDPNLTNSTVGGPRAIRLYENLGATTSPGLPRLALPVDVVSPATPGLASESFFEPATADIDGDGDLDLLVAGDREGTSGYLSRVHTCTNVGSAKAPAFARCTTEVQTGLLYNTIDTADWDGDGVMDVLRGYYGSLQQNPVTMLHGKGPDGDADGISDSIDNCVQVPNPALVKLNRDNPVQLDNDADGIGDPCDGDLDGDGVLQAASENAGGDTCVYRPNSNQADVDSDGRGDLCDPKNDLPDAYGVGTYEWQQAEKTGWGRKPVIVMRADAMSVGYRQQIAERLTTEALDRGLPMSLAMIPWDDSRLSQAAATDFVREHAENPLLETVQHGTYHACVMAGKPAYGEEFGSPCGMDESQSYNLMKVGKDAMDAALAPVTPSHALTGFIPPADAANGAAVAAAKSLGYSYFASAYYAEPKMFHTDDAGMVHVPWSQIACGNGAASWTNCAQADLQAHGGVDCADAELCTPTRGANADKDYSDWDKFAQTRLSERCRNDFDRYGTCAVLFELTSYDIDFATGLPDERAMDAYSATLDELQAMAKEEDAVFLTVGQFAAAQRAHDELAPSINVAAPTERVYGPSQNLVVDVDVRDKVSGVYRTSITLDGKPIGNGASIALDQIGEGQHVLAVEAEDEAGNVANQAVTFTVDATAPTIQVTSPTAGRYGHHEKIEVDVTVDDAVAGVAGATYALDGVTVHDGDMIDLVTLALGTHVLAVRAEDNVGNVSEKTVTFTVEATITSLRALVERFAAEGQVSDAGLTRSLLAKLDAAAASQDAGRTGAAQGQITSFIQEVAAHRGGKITPAAADTLTNDAQSVRAGLNAPKR